MTQHTPYSSKRPYKYVGARLPIPTPSHPPSPGKERLVFDHTNGEWRWGRWLWSAVRGTLHATWQFTT